MREDELRAAIERPAFQVGCELEPGLTERLLADVEGQAGALPLLQFTLDELWKKRREVRRLTLRAYTELGGVEGALEHRANEILQKLSRRTRTSAVGFSFAWCSRARGPRTPSGASPITSCCPTTPRGPRRSSGWSGSWPTATPG